MQQLHFTGGQRCYFDSLSLDFPRHYGVLHCISTVIAFVSVRDQFADNYWSPSVSAISYANVLVSWRRFTSSVLTNWWGVAGFLNSVWEGPDRVVTDMCKLWVSELLAPLGGLDSTTLHEGWLGQWPIGNMTWMTETLCQHTWTPLTSYLCISFHYMSISVLMGDSWLWHYRVDKNVSTDRQTPGNIVVLYVWWYIFAYKPGFPKSHSVIWTQRWTQASCVVEESVYFSSGPCRLSREKRSFQSASQLAPLVIEPLHCTNMDILIILSPYGQWWTVTE